MSDAMHLTYQMAVEHLGHRVELHGWSSGLIDDCDIDNILADDLPPTVTIECVTCDVRLVQVVETSQNVRASIVKSRRAATRAEREEQERADEDMAQQYRDHKGE